MIPWTEKMYDMDEAGIANYKSAFVDEYHNSEVKHEREVVDIIYIEYQYYQVRKTYKWVQEQYQLSGDKMAIRREILMQRLRGSNSCPIDPEDIEYLISNMKKSDRDILIRGKWRFRIYDHGAGFQYGRPKDLDENIPYLVGIDPAGGGGTGDNFAITIKNPYNLQTAAEFKSPYINGPEAVRMLVELVNDYIPKAVLIPEKNNMGCYLIQMLLETSIRDNLYWSESARQLEAMVEENESDNELKKLAVKYKKYGHATTVKSRSQMFNILFNYVNACKDLLLTEYMVDDMCKLIRTAAGRYEADKGEHDDVLMSHLICLYTYEVGDNLERFGITRMVHPVIGTIEENYDEHIEERYGTSDGFFSTADIKNYDSEVMEDAIRMESEIKELVEHFDWVDDGLYSKRKSENTNPYDDTVTIGTHFFDNINNTY